MEIKLTDKSSISLYKLPESLIKYSNENFDKIYQLHPIENGKIIMDGTEVTSTRYHKSYLCTPDYDSKKHITYMFNGYNQYDNSRELPKEFEIYLNYVNESEPNDDKYNQVTVNWYHDGHSHVPYHSDCTVDLKKESKIVVISLGESRTFAIASKHDCDIANKIKEKFILNNGDVLSMNGDFQNEFRHSLLRDEDYKGKRISISFRKYCVNSE